MRNEAMKVTPWTSSVMFTRKPPHSLGQESLLFQFTSVAINEHYIAFNSLIFCNICRV